MQKLKHRLIELWRWAAAHRLWLIITGFVGVTLVITVMTVSYWMISPYRSYVISPQQIKDKKIDTGLVLGAGVNKQGKPYKELKARLDLGADAISKGSVKKLILSGDNRFKSYNEPAAMKRYLVEQRHINPRQLTLDYAGRSTYESCERAAKTFGQSKLVIFSAGSHLPRAIYLCRHFGIEAYGESSGVEANNSWRRELLARVKAVFNVYVLGEKTVLGMPTKI